MFKYYLCMGEMQIVLESVKPLCLGDRAAVFQTERDLADICYSIEARIVLPEGKLIYSSADYQVYENGTEQYRVFSGSRNRIVLKRSKEAPCHSWIYVDEESLQELQSVLVTRYLALEEPFLSCHAFLLHASLIRWGTHGIAFTAPSGIGKSTQAELWRQYQGADVLNGDRALLRNTGQEIRAYGSVFAGSSGIYRNESVRLSAVIVLEQAAENELTQLWGGEGIFTAVQPDSLKSMEFGICRTAIEGASDYAGACSGVFAAVQTGCRGSGIGEAGARENYADGTVISGFRKHIM